MESELKDKWNGIDFKNAAGEEIIRKIIAGRRATAIDRLEKRYKRMGIMCLIFAVFIPLEMLLMFDVGQKWIIFWSFAAFFFVGAAMDFWLSNGIGTINVYEMTVSEVVSKALWYKKRHLQFELVLLPMAAIVLAEMWCFIGQVYEGLWISMLLGGVVGLALAMWVFFKFMKDYKSIKNG